MDRIRVVDRGSYPGFLQRLGDAVAVIDPDHEVVIDLFRVCLLLVQAHLAAEQLSIETRDLPAWRGPLAQQTELAEKDRGLERVEPAPVPDLVVLVLSRAAVIAQRPKLCCDSPVVRYDGSGITEGSKIFPGIEAIRAGDPEPT